VVFLFAVAFSDARDEMRNGWLGGGLECGLGLDDLPGFVDFCPFDFCCLFGGSVRHKKIVLEGNSTLIDEPRSSHFRVPLTLLRICRGEIVRALILT
jgi:hypothetical protein